MLSNKNVALILLTSEEQSHMSREVGGEGRLTEAPYSSAPSRLRQISHTSRHCGHAATVLQSAAPTNNHVLLINPAQQAGSCSLRI